MEVVSGRQEVEQAATFHAARVGALGDVEAVGDGVLLKLQAQAVEGGDHLLGRAVFLDDLIAEHSAVGGPESVPAAVICRHHQMAFTHRAAPAPGRATFRSPVYSRASTMIINVPFFFRRPW